MNKSGLFRKIAYIAAIVLLLGPLFALGRPNSGVIGQLRTKHKMGQANLGKLDPTSESMRLATLGMKGIASTILWLRADYYKEEKYFDRFSATLNQIALMQPHFISVWQHQAHNLSYNVAPEFEDYRQRYEWIKKGIDYLIRGTKYNERKPILQYDLGHYVGNKLGKADEHVQYRSLYRKDSEFHKYFKEKGLAGIETSALGFDQRPDNWLSGKLWFEQAYGLYQAGAPIKKSPHLLFSYAPLWHMYYGEAIESEGVLDSSARFAWKQAGDEWAQYGTIALFQFRQTTDLTLLSRDRARTDVLEFEREFDALTGDAKNKAIEILRKGISAEKLQLFDKPESERLPDEAEAYYDVFTRLKPSVQMITAQLPAKDQLTGLELARKLTTAKEYLREVESYRGQVNYEYWQQRAEAEQREDVIEARRLIYEADQLINLADVKGALDSYESAWKRWSQVFRRYPSMMSEDVGDDVLKSVGRYKRLLDTDLDDTFVLNKFLKYRKAKEAEGDPTINVQAMDDEFKAEANRIREAELRGESIPTEPEAEKIPEAVAKDTPVPAPIVTETPSTPAPAPQVEAKGNASELPSLPPPLENPDSQN